jgi:hypothetical protein
MHLYSGLLLFDSHPSELHTFGVPHAFDSHPEFAESCAALTDFFREREILHPRTYPSIGVRAGAQRRVAHSAGLTGPIVGVAEPRERVWQCSVGPHFNR